MAKRKRKQKGIDFEIDKKYKDIADLDISTNQKADKDIHNKKEIDETYVSPALKAHRKKHNITSPTRNLAWTPSKDQILYAHALANPYTERDNMSRRQLALTLGITSSSYYNWIRDQRFINMVNDLIPLYTDGIVPDMWRKLIDIAMKGDLSAIQTFFKLKGAFPKEATNQTINIQTIETELLELNAGETTGHKGEHSEQDVDLSQTIEADFETLDDIGELEDVI